MGGGKGIQGVKARPQGGGGDSQKLWALVFRPPWAFSKAASPKSPPFLRLSGQQWARSSRAGLATHPGKAVWLLQGEEPPASDGQEGRSRTGGFLEPRKCPQIP